MSWSTRSIEELARTIPVRPPRVKRKMNPSAQSIGASKEMEAPFMVESHLNTFTPVGTAITIVAEVK